MPYVAFAICPLHIASSYRRGVGQKGGWVADQIVLGIGARGDALRAHNTLKLEVMRMGFFDKWQTQEGEPQECAELDRLRDSVLKANLPSRVHEVAQKEIKKLANTTIPRQRNTLSASIISSISPACLGT